MADDSPVVKLTNLILLSAMNKQASVIEIYRDGGDGVVDLVIDGERHEEIRPPVALIPYVVRRLAVMAALPVYGRDEEVEGRFAISVGDRPATELAIRVAGHGDALHATLWLLERPAS